MVRVRSTQKLPSPVVERRTNPRTSAASTAIPVAAETKFCTVSAAIWTRWLIVDSPPYACQLVFEAKLTAVFQATYGSTAGKPAGSSGSACWSRWRA